jgi:hypothetical protein
VIEWGAVFAPAHSRFWHKADISQMEFGGMIFAVQSQIAGGTGFLAAGYGRRQGRDDRVETTIWLVHSVAACCPAADV